MTNLNYMCTFYKTFPTILVHSRIGINPSNVEVNLLNNHSNKHENDNEYPNN